MCAGLIGYRSLKMAGDARRLGLYGIGAAAHIVAQVARHQGRELYAFTRDRDVASQEFVPLAAAARVHTEVTTFALEDANRALSELRAGHFQGAGVLLCR